MGLIISNTLYEGAQFFQGYLAIYSVLSLVFSVCVWDDDERGG